MLAVFLIALFALVLIGAPIAFSLVGTGFFMSMSSSGVTAFWRGGDLHV